MISLITEQELKDSGLIDKNMLSNYLAQAIELAQDTGLQLIIGTSLYEKLRNEEIQDDELMSKIKPYLLYKSVSELQMLNEFKMRNAGTVYANDVNYGTVPIETVEHIANYYAEKARFYGNQLSKWLIVHQIPEYLEEMCDGISADPLHYNTGLWLKHKICKCKK